MEDILLIQMLKKKGMLTDSDVHELTHSPKQESTVYMTSNTKNHPRYIGEEKAISIVSQMYHYWNGRKYMGEKFDMYKAKDVLERYKNVLPVDITPCEIYIAINMQYHDYFCLFTSWALDDIDHKIIQSAITYWFLDEDYKGTSKVIDFIG